MDAKALLTRILGTAILAGAFATILAAPAGAAVLSHGSSGPAVSALTKRLAELSYLPAGASGSRFTLRTHHAVVAFQKVHRLAPDGQVGPMTSRALKTASVPKAALARTGTRIEVLRTTQVAQLVVGGRVHRTINVSSGKAGYATPTGSFRVFRREAMSWSNPYQVWLPWAAYFNGGIAFHEHRDVPAYPASHGCVRVPSPFAKEVYDFARMGRVVEVVNR